MIGSQICCFFTLKLTGTVVPSFFVQKGTRGLLLCAGNYPLIEPETSLHRPIFVSTQRICKASSLCSEPEDLDNGVRTSASFGLISFL